MLWLATLEPGLDNAALKQADLTRGWLQVTNFGQLFDYELDRKPVRAAGATSWKAAGSGARKAQSVTIGVALQAGDVTSAQDRMNALETVAEAATTLELYAPASTTRVFERAILAYQGMSPARLGLYGYTVALTFEMDLPHAFGTFTDGTNQLVDAGGQRLVAPLEW